MSSNGTYEVFSGLVENRPSKFVFILSSVVIDVVNIGMAYGVIWYDRYGVDMKQTLMNKLITSICWGSIINVPMLQVLVFLTFLALIQQLWILF